MTRPLQRIGHIGTDDNRFCGAAVFAELAPTVDSQVELVARALGIPHLAAIDREVLRAISLGLCSPDARVWPLKLTRTLAAYGNPYAGFFGAQLVTASDRIGPGATAAAAASLCWLRAEVGDDPDPDRLAAAVARHVATRGRIAGFGVPFRDEDERLVFLRRHLASHPASRRPTWRLFEALAAAMRTRHQLAPNIVIAMAALLVDLGCPPPRAGLLATLLMTHTFAGHAAEAAELDGPWLRELPISAIDDRSRPPRRSPAAQAALVESSLSA